MKAEKVFEEWDSYAKKKKLLHRKIRLDSVAEISRLKIVALTGVRRSGKSSLLMMLAQKMWRDGEKAGYINLEDSRLAGGADVLDGALKWFGEEGFLLLDEITSINGWEGWLSRVHEMLKGKLRIIVSSSRSGLLKPAKPLRGRILPVRIYPLSFREFLEFKGTPIEKTVAGKGTLEKAFSEYLVYGGFPEVALSSGALDKVLIAGSYFKDILGLDVADISGEEVGIVEEFGRYVLSAPYFSASKCLNSFKSSGRRIGKGKLLLLEKCSEDAFLFFFVPIFSYNLKDASQYPRKAYAGDLAFAYAAGGEINLGRAYENAAFLELKARVQGNYSINYWKNPSGLETDFVVRQGKRVLEAIQVVYEMGAETEKREINGLVACAKELKAECATLLTKDISGQREVDGVKIRIVPLMDWMLEPGFRREFEEEVETARARMAKGENVSLSSLNELDNEVEKA